MQEEKEAGKIISNLLFNFWAKHYLTFRDNDTPENREKWTNLANTKFTELSSKELEFIRIDIINIINVLNKIVNTISINTENTIRPILIQLVRSDPGNYGWLEENYPEMYELIKDE